MICLISANSMRIRMLNMVSICCIILFRIVVYPYFNVEKLIGENLLILSCKTVGRSKGSQGSTLYFALKFS
jgi:hypothetical protein